MLMENDKEMTVRVVCVTKGWARSVVECLPFSTFVSVQVQGVHAGDPVNQTQTLRSLHVLLEATSPAAVP